MAGLGTVMQWIGRFPAAIDHKQQALGDHARAGEHYQQALTLYTALGLPEADEIRALLAV